MENIKSKLIEAAKEYASQSKGGITVNNPELYNVFRDGQESAIEILNHSTIPQLQYKALSQITQEGRERFKELHPESDSEFERHSFLLGILEAEYKILSVKIDYHNEAIEAANNLKLISK